MADTPKHAVIRIVVLMMLLGSLGGIGYGAWLMSTDQGAPIFIFVAAAMLGAFASILAGQLKKK